MGLSCLLWRAVLSLAGRRRARAEMKATGSWAICGVMSLGGQVLGLVGRGNAEPRGVSMGRPDESPPYTNIGGLLPDISWTR